MPLRDLGRASGGRRKLGFLGDRRVDLQMSIFVAHERTLARVFPPFTRAGRDCCFCLNVRNEFARNPRRAQPQLYMVPERCSVRARWRRGSSEGSRSQDRAKALRDGTYRPIGSNQSGRHAMAKLIVTRPRLGWFWDMEQRFQRADRRQSQHADRSGGNDRDRSSAGHSSGQCRVAGSREANRSSSKGPRDRSIGSE